MRIIVGLGNPGKEYEQTRHNVGFMVVEALAWQIGDGQWQMVKNFQSEVLKLDARRYKLVTDLLLAKPQTYMNNSGLAVKKIAKSYKLPANSLYVVHDDLDLPLGRYKIQFGKGPHVHNGVRSVEQHLKTKDFWRVRVGIAGKHLETLRARGGSVADEYVLRPFPRKEREWLQTAIQDLVVELIRQGEPANG